MIGEMQTSKHVSIFGGMIALLLGLLVVIYHNVWSGEYWQILITILGWLTLLKGIIHLVFPGWPIKLAGKMKRSGMSFWLVVVLVIGAYLAYVGFWM